MTMYRKYLLKRHFWAVPKKNGGEPNCYVRHDIKVGGIYAYLQHRGVRIIADNQVKTFNNFTDLDLYLDKLQMFKGKENKNSEFVAILNRRSTTKLLRKIPI